MHVHRQLADTLAAERSAQAEHRAFYARFRAEQRTADREQRLTIRVSAAADADRLQQLADLDEEPALGEPALLAEVDGRLVAAIGLVSGRQLADPFAATADVRELLSLRAGQLEQPARRPRRWLPRAGLGW